MDAQAMAPPQGGGQMDPQAIKLLMQILSQLRRDPRSWPQLHQMAVRAGIPQQILPPPNAPMQVLAQFARKLVMFLRSYSRGGAQPTQQQAPMQSMQPGPAMAMAYGGPVLDVTAGQDRPAMAMAYGGQVLDVTASPASPALAMNFGGRVDSVHALLRPGEYVATPEAIAADPTLDDRISAMNRATGGGREGPIVLAQRGNNSMDWEAWKKSGDDRFMPGHPGAEQPGRLPDLPTGRPNGGSPAPKPPSKEQLERHRESAQREIKANMRLKKERR